MIDVKCPTCERDLRDEIDVFVNTYQAGEFEWSGIVGVICNHCDPNGLRPFKVRYEYAPFLVKAERVNEQNNQK